MPEWKRLTLGLFAALGAAAATPALAEAPATQKITHPASVAELLTPCQTRWRR